MTWVSFDYHGKRHRLALAKDGRGVWVGYPGGAAFVTAKRHAAEAARDDAVRAPMTGRVVQVKVASGDEVKANDVLVVLEAMKMEYRLTAPQEGRVEAVLCAAGQLIESGAVVVRLESEAAACARPKTAAGVQTGLTAGAEAGAAADSAAARPKPAGVEPVVLEPAAA